METKYIFNFLKPVNEPLSSWDKIYIWIIGKARIILIIIQLFILFAFFSKFVIDNIAKTKEKEFNKLLSTYKKNYVETKKEELFRNYFTKGTNYKTIWEKSQATSPTLEKVFLFIDVNALEVNIIVNIGELTISGYDTPTKIKAIEDYLKSSKEEFSDTTTQVSEKTEDISVGKSSFKIQSTILNHERKEY